jgi:hypothetical protein
MQKRALSRVFGVFWVAAACGCGGGAGGGGGDGDSDTDTTHGSTPFGQPCAADAECADGACVSDVCSRDCDRYSDCPEAGYRCGASGDRTVCLPSDASGDGIGQNCTFDPCPAGLSCYSRGEEDPQAYCSKACTDAMECPAGFICQGTIENPDPHCRVAEFCDQCAIDDDCGIGGRYPCLTDQGGVRYCSVVCDPALATCPAGGTCEARDGADPACVPAGGVCGPTGGLCSTCSSDADCDAGGHCLSDELSGGVFCGSPCSLQADCPFEYYCNAAGTLVSGDPSPDAQCYPRTGDCGQPSRGGTMCMYCDTIADCYNGFCLNIAGYSGCGEDCGTNGDADCPPFATCQPFTLQSGETIHNCVPANDNPCFMWQQCLEQYGAGECADGSECVAGSCRG